MAEITEEMWLQAKDYFDRVRRIYQEREKSSDSYASITLNIYFSPLLIRYNRGERTQKLYDEMMSVEID